LHITFVQPVVAEVTGFRNPVHSRGIILVVPHVILFEIEHSHVVGTRDQTVSTANAPVLVNDDYAVFAPVRCLHGADQGAGRMIALVAQKRYGDFLGILDFPTYFRLSDPVNVDTGVIMQCDIVFFSACIYTRGTITLALSYIDDHSPSFAG
jgi:hypothetical protein